MTSIFRGMDQATLDLAYNNGVAVPTLPAIMSDFVERSLDTYRQRPCHRDISYGNRARQRFDWFSAPAGSSAPTIVFIHCGYWQSRSKEDFAMIAAGPLARGFNVVLAEYTLAPEAKMSGIVAEIGQLLKCLTSHGEFGGSKFAPVPRTSKLILVGHSAGGQLAAHYRSHPEVDGVLAISGVFDLEPIRLSYLDQALALSEHEVAEFSPQRHLAAGAPVQLAVGDEELPELIRHTEDYAQALAAAGVNVHTTRLAGRNHFTVLEELAKPDGALVKLLQTLAAGS
jgi:acetyl esterase/lipase